MDKFSIWFLLQAFLLGCTALVAAGAPPAATLTTGQRYALTFLFALFTVATLKLL